MSDLQSSSLALASLAFSLQSQSRTDAVLPATGPSTRSGHKIPATAVSFGPRDRGRRLNAPKGFFSNQRQQAQRWLSGIGVGNGGPTFFGPNCKHAALSGILPGFLLRPLKQAVSPKQKKVLVLMSNTGGGHRASAEALEAGFKQLYGDKFHFDIVDVWKDHTPQPFSSMPDTYSFLVKQPILWRLTYMSQQPRIIHKPYLWSCGNLIGRHVNALFAKFNPDLVISVHPLMQHIPIRVLKRRIRKGLMDPINFATVVTDFTTCSNLWFHRGASKCFVPTEFAAQRARLFGLKDDQIVLHGLPIRPGFSNCRTSKPMLRRKLGLSQNLPAVLMVGGGEGMGKLETTVSAIAARGIACQVVVICGRNDVLRRQLSSDAYSKGATKVHAFGFVKNMHEFMNACDAIITKAGPGTIAEALISGLPILLNGNVPCQEEGNIPFVVDNGAGAFERDPGRIADIVGDWFSEQGENNRLDMAAASKALGRPDALFKIVRDLADLAMQGQTSSVHLPQPTFAAAAAV